MKEAAHKTIVWIAVIFAALAIVVSGILLATAMPRIEELGALFVPAIAFGLPAWATRVKSNEMKGTANA